MVQSLQLKGHKSSVLSLAHSSNTISFLSNNQGKSKKKQRKENVPNYTICHLLSGDESGTTRIWDLRCNPYRASNCIIAPDDGNGREVTAVGFHPLFDTNSSNNESADNDSLEGCPFTVYTAVGSKVYGYDLRNTSSPIISEYDFHISSIDGGEEINGMDFFYLPKQDKTYIATADDDGMIRITDSIQNKSSSSLSSSQQCRSFQHSDDGTSTLVTSLAFRPRSMKSLDVATAGTDCTICLWDINRPHNRPSSSLFIHQDNDDGAAKAGVNQICNPPIVHSLSWSPSGRLLSAGLGDGSCLIACLDGRKLNEVCRLRDGHDSAVASVIFPQFGPSSSLSSSFSHVTAEDRLMISAGSDGSILLWDLGSNIAGDNAVDPTSMFLGFDGGRNDSANENVGDLSSAVKGLSVSKDGAHPEILFGIPHGKKINWMVNSSAHDPALSNSLFVADTGNDIAVYTLPRE